jgi:glycosyltransferase involved in cell wall biosynthesis
LQAPSHAVASRILAEAPTLAEKVRAIPYPLTTAASELPRPISGRDKIVLFVGRVHPEKGVHLLVDAFVTGARSALADWKLMIIGPAETKLGGGGEAYLRTLQQAAEPAKDKITFGGPIFDVERLADVYRNARLFVYPSLSERGESFGLAPLEAMAHGCAVLVSGLQCFHDFIQDAETGFVFDYRGPAVAESFRSRLENVLSDEQSLARVAQSGHRKSAEYSVERVADRFLSDFEEVQTESG